jgi:hypothetical protein
MLAYTNLIYNQYTKETQLSDVPLFLACQLARELAVHIHCNLAAGVVYPE